ncbi:hypothetical protein GCM10020295_83610 [Streptomyces cinereospinus]
MTTAEEYGTALEPVEVVDAELVEDDAPDAGAVAVHDPVEAVLAALDADAKEHLHDIRPKKTKDGYARDWEIWGSSTTGSPNEPAPACRSARSPWAPSCRS